MEEYLKLIITAMVPIGELRVSIPLGLTVYGFDIVETYLFSVIGNMIPIFFIVFLLRLVSSPGFETPAHAPLQTVRINDRSLWDRIFVRHGGMKKVLAGGGCLSIAYNPLSWVPGCLAREVAEPASATVIAGGAWNMASTSAMKVRCSAGALLYQLRR